MDGSYHVYMLLISQHEAIQEAEAAAFLLDVVAAAALLIFPATWEETIILIKQRWEMSMYSESRFGLYFLDVLMHSLCSIFLFEPRVLNFLHYSSTPYRLATVIQEALFSDDAYRVIQIFDSGPRRPILSISRGTQKAVSCY